MRNVPNVEFVNFDMCASQVISISQVVVSIPFTSTALLAKDQKIKSFYFDPGGFVLKADRGAHGVPILSGKDDLAATLKKLRYKPLRRD